MSVSLFSLSTHEHLTHIIRGRDLSHMIRGRELVIMGYDLGHIVSILSYKLAHVVIIIVILIGYLLL